MGRALDISIAVGLSSAAAARPRPSLPSAARPTLARRRGVPPAVGGCWSNRHHLDHGRGVLRPHAVPWRRGVNCW